MFSLSSPRAQCQEGRIHTPWVPGRAGEQIWTVRTMLRGKRGSDPQIHYLSKVLCGDGVLHFSSVVDHTGGLAPCDQSISGACCIHSIAVQQSTGCALYQTSSFPSFAPESGPEPLDLSRRSRHPVQAIRRRPTRTRKIFFAEAAATPPAFIASILELKKFGLSSEVNDVKDGGGLGFRMKRVQRECVSAGCSSAHGSTNKSIGKPKLQPKPSYIQ